MKNAPWPTSTSKQKGTRIDDTSQVILDAMPSILSLTRPPLYNETTMLSELDKAHQQNNKAILRRQDYYRDFWCGRANGMVSNNSADSQKG